MYVNVSEYGFTVEPRYYFYGWSRSPMIVGREPAVRALLVARSRLPVGFNFKIWDMKRSLKTQALMRASFRRRLRLANPDLPGTELEALVTRFGAKYSSPRRAKRDTHIRGGAVDLTILDDQGSELYMGTDHDDLSAKAALDYYEATSPRSALDRAAQMNRRMLKRSMLAAGFSPYRFEWWHWSFDADLSSDQLPHRSDNDARKSGVKR
jgi:zinc D-Ala-D-Ala dipeptidase